MILTKTMLFWALGLLLYCLFKRHIHAPTHRRFVLLGVIIGGLLLNAPLPHFYSANDALVSLSLPVIETSGPFLSSDQTIHFSWWTLWLSIYFAGIALFSLTFFRELSHLLGIIKKSEHLENYILLEDSEEIFSFLGMIFVGDRVELSEKELQMALHHEKQHVEQRHSFDILLISILQILFWFFPIWPWLKKELQLVHELEADQKVIIKYNAHQYAGLLVRMSKRGALTSVHYFAQSLTKKRLQAMIYNNQSSITTKTIFGFLLISCLWLFMACTEGEDTPSLRTSDTKLSNPNLTDGEDDEVYKIVEVMPVLESCKSAEQPSLCLLQKFYNYVSYPEDARQKGEEGTSVVSFIVEKDGSSSNIELARKISTSIDQAALSAVKEFTTDHPWVPGMQNGKEVRVKYLLPIKFKLSDEE